MWPIQMQALKNAIELIYIIHVIEALSTDRGEHTCRYNRFSYLNHCNYNVSQDFLQSTGIKIAFFVRAQ